MPVATTSTLSAYTWVLMPNFARYLVSWAMLAGVWPYVAANWPTDRKFLTPPATAAFRCARFRSRMMNDTVSGVSGGVSPKAVAPGSAATSVPCCTGTWELGLGLGLGVAARGDAEAAGAMIIIVASAARYEQA